MKSQMSLSIFSILLAASLAPCTGTPLEDAPILMHVTDASVPAASTGPAGSAPRYEHVFVTVSELAVRPDGSTNLNAGAQGADWIVVSTAETTLDLVVLNAGVSELLVNSRVPVGVYSGIRAIISSASVVVSGQTSPVKLSSSATSGLIAEGTLLIDTVYNTDALLSLNGMANLSYSPTRGYTMAPTLQLLSIDYQAPESPTSTPQPGPSDQETPKPGDAPNENNGSEPPTATPVPEGNQNGSPADGDEGKGDPSPTPSNNAPGTDDGKDEPSPTPAAGTGSGSSPTDNNEGTEQSAATPDPGPAPGTDPSYNGGSTPSPTPISLPDPGGN